MQEKIMTALAEAGPGYWWNQGRHYLVRRLWETYARPPAGRCAKMLDIGCAAGGMLLSLSRWGDAYGLDVSAEALRLCAAAGVAPDKLCQGRVEDMKDFPDDEFDLVTAVDVLEHVEDPRAALSEIRRVTRPGGLVILTVPADPRLASDRDQRLGHFRRYTVRQLAAEVGQAGLTVVRASYANSFYYWPYRLLLAWRRRRQKVPVVSQDTFFAKSRWSGLFAFCLNVETEILLRTGLPGRLGRVRGAEGGEIEQVEKMEQIEYGNSQNAQTEKLGN